MSAPVAVHVCTAMYWLLCIGNIFLDSLLAVTECFGPYFQSIVHAFAAGNRTSQALLGLQLVPGQQTAFNEVIQELEAEFTFTTLPEDARRVFNMFIQ